MESVRCPRAMCRRIGKRINDLQLLDNRAGPSMRDDERQRILMLRTNVNEMNVQPIDLGDELRKPVQLRLALAPVVLRLPIARECLHRRELHALRLVVDGLLLGPARGRDASTQVIEGRLGDLDLERAECSIARCLFGHDTHVGPPWLGTWLRDATKLARLGCPSRPGKPLVCSLGYPGSTESRFPQGNTSAARQTTSTTSATAISSPARTHGLRSEADRDGCGGSPVSTSRRMSRAAGRRMPRRARRAARRHRNPVRRSPARDGRPTPRPKGVANPGGNSASAARELLGQVRWFRSCSRRRDSRDGRPVAVRGRELGQRRKHLLGSVLGDPVDRWEVRRAGRSRDLPGWTVGRRMRPRREACSPRLPVAPVKTLVCSPGLGPGITRARSGVRTRDSAADGN